MHIRSQKKRVFLIILTLIFSVASAVILFAFPDSGENSFLFNAIFVCLLVMSSLAFLWLIADPDSHSARQSDELLKLASQTLDCAKTGMTHEAAQKICEILLPATPAIAVAITDREQVLGYAGYNEENNQPGRKIRTIATKSSLQDGKPRIVYHSQAIGLPESSSKINAAIVEPLYIGKNIEGTIKFYYRNPFQVSKTQESIIHGLAELLSTQMAASALEDQKKLTTSMELKALQAQINPHFLFNTINTIVSLIRTDPNKARDLLREFAFFYRSTLEDSEDLIPLKKELQQVERYYQFEVARFGEERLELKIDIEDGLEELLVPSFIIQPLVENSIKHAMRAEGVLSIRIKGRFDGNTIIIKVIDNGVGMSQETIDSMFTKESETGLGMAVKNAKSRIKGYFGPNSKMTIDSKVGKGTTVTFLLFSDVSEEGKGEIDQLQESAIPDIPKPVIV